MDDYYVMNSGIPLNNEIPEKFKGFQMYDNRIELNRNHQTMSEDLK